MISRTITLNMKTGERTVKDVPTEKEIDCTQLATMLAEKFIEKEQDNKGVINNG